MLMLYRPFLCHSHDEVLFGRNEKNGGFAPMGIQTSMHGLEHLLVKKAAPMLEGALQDQDTLPLMAQYGDVTVICIISNVRRGGGALLAGEESRSVRGRSSPGATPLDKEGLTSVCTASGPTPILSLSARLLHIERNPVTSNGGCSSSSGGAQGPRMGILWMQPMLRDNHDDLLLRVECPLATERLLNERKHVLPGQLIYWEGLRPTHLPTQSTSISEGSGTQSESDEANGPLSRFDIPAALTSHVMSSSGVTMYHFTLVGPHDGAVQCSSNSGVGMHYCQAGEVHQQSSVALQHEIAASSVVKRALNLSRLTAILHSRSIFAPPVISDPAQAVKVIKGAALGCVQLIATVSRIQAVDNGGVVEVIDVTGNGNAALYHPGQGRKRRRGDENRPANNSSGNGSGHSMDDGEDVSDDSSAWMLTLSGTDGTAASSGTVQALLSLHDSMVLTPALDPRSNLANKNMAKKREGVCFSFLLSKIDDVLSPKRIEKYQLGPDTALFRVNACTVLDL